VNVGNNYKIYENMSYPHTVIMPTFRECFAGLRALTTAIIKPHDVRDPGENASTEKESARDLSGYGLQPCCQADGDVASMRTKTTRHTLPLLLTQA